MIYTLLDATIQKYDNLQDSRVDDTIRWEERVIVENLYEDNALYHFIFQRAHLQGVAEKIWSQLCPNHRW